MPHKTLTEIVAEKPFPDYMPWWAMGSSFIAFMSRAIVGEWWSLADDPVDIAPVETALREYMQQVYRRQLSPNLLADFIAESGERTFFSGEFDALSYAFFRAAFERLARQAMSPQTLATQRRHFTQRVGELFFDQLADHLQLALPPALDTPQQFQQLKTCTAQIGAFLREEGYLRDHFAFTYNVQVEHAGRSIQQTEADVLPALREKGLAFALYEMGYPAILPSAVYLYHTMGEAQHHSSRTIEELFKRIGYRAYETDDFDPTDYPSERVVELWEIRTLG